MKKYKNTKREKKRILKTKNTINKKNIFNVEEGTLGLLKGEVQPRGFLHDTKMKKLTNQLNSILRKYIKYYPTEYEYRSPFINSENLENAIDTLSSLFFNNYSGYYYTLSITIERVNKANAVTKIHKEVNIVLKELEGLPLAYGSYCYDLTENIEERSRIHEDKALYDTDRSYAKESKRIGLFPRHADVDIKVMFFLVFYNEFMNPYDYLLSDFLYKKGLTYCRIERFLWTSRLKKIGKKSYSNLQKAQRNIFLFCIRQCNRKLSRKLLKELTNLKGNIFLLCGLDQLRNSMKQIQKILIKKGYETNLKNYLSEAVIPSVRKSHYSLEIREYLAKLMRRGGLTYLLTSDRLLSRDHRSRTSYQDLEYGLLDFFYNQWVCNPFLSSCLYGIKGDILGQIQAIQKNYRMFDLIPLGVDIKEDKYKAKPFMFSPGDNNWYVPDDTNLFPSALIDPYLIEFKDGYYYLRDGLFLKTIDVNNEKLLKTSVSNHLFSNFIYQYGRPFLASNYYLDYTVNEIKWPKYSIHFVLTRFSTSFEGILFMQTLGALLHRNEPGKDRQRLIVLRGSKDSGKTTLLDCLFKKGISSKFVSTLYHTETTYQEYYDEAYENMKKELTKRRGETTHEEITFIIENINISKITKSWLNFQDNISTDLLSSVAEKLAKTDFESTILSTRLSEKEINEALIEGGLHLKKGLNTDKTGSMFYIFSLKDADFKNNSIEYKNLKEKENLRVEKEIKERQEEEKRKEQLILEKQKRDQEIQNENEIFEKRKMELVEFLQLYRPIGLGSPIQTEIENLVLKNLLKTIDLNSDIDFMGLDPTSFRINYYQSVKQLMSDYEKLENKKLKSKKIEKKVEKKVSVELPKSSISKIESIKTEKNNEISYMSHIELLNETFLKEENNVLLPEYKNFQKVLEREAFSFIMFCNLLYLSVKFPSMRFNYPSEWYTDYFDFKTVFNLGINNGKEVLEKFILIQKELNISL